MPTTEFDPFASARSEEDDDQILSLFRQWCDVTRAANIPGADDDETDVDTAIAEQIFNAPVVGAVGLAIKAFLFAYEVEAQYCLGTKYRRGDDPCAIRRLRPDDTNYSSRLDARTGTWSDAQLYLMQHAMRGLLDAASRFEPDLVPLVAGIVSSPQVAPTTDASLPAPEIRIGISMREEQSEMPMTVYFADGAWRPATEAELAENLRRRPWHTEFVAPAVLRRILAEEDGEFFALLAERRAINRNAFDTSTADWTLTETGRRNLDANLRAICETPVVTDAGAAMRLDLLFRATYAV